VSVGPREVFGLEPLGPALRQCWAALVGDAHAPPGKWGPSSLRILRPWLSIPIWLGRDPVVGEAIVYNLPNRRPQPFGEGYSVRVTYARDYRGGRLTYDGHVGTDFAVPAGTLIVAAASGVVVDVRHDMQRGGRKVCIDHGGNLVTTSNHLARALVEVDQRVVRGEAIGLSGMSGVDGVLFFPWLAPHLHFNVLLDGVPVDPFAAAGEVALWNGGGLPVPCETMPTEFDAPPSNWDAARVDAAIASCRDPELRRELCSIASLGRRAVCLAIVRTFFSHRFDAPTPLCEPTPRRPRLDLPLPAARYRGVAFADSL
jgi:Peptidase family M23